ncbi:U3 snoRNP-associated protein Utp11 [Zalerion maritima]|uniref:U3 snoRNP-associated protein Utp11 n=1 Tax=Zalerion maritima TaxID=339359 RepID=A0AAD5WTJ0_9PEZI|nr:U3 snoRNP-associated protein Utp11 [Zalerion maritima]
MGGFKKVIQRAPYKERSQPIARKKLGLLEKHKDYSLRAASHNRKKSQLRSLRLLASNRNEDEFHHGMLSRRGPSRSTLTSGTKKWDGTVAADRGSKVLDIDAVRLLKTQDMGYVRTVRNVAQREVRRLREKVVLAESMLGGAAHEKEDDDDDDSGDGDSDLGGLGLDLDIDFGLPHSKSSSSKPHPQSKPKKIVFAEDPETRDQYAADAEEDRSDEPEAAPQKDPSTDPKVQLELRKLQLQRLRRRLETAERKLQALAMAEHEMEQQRARMGKTATTGVVTKKGNMKKVNVRKR